MSVLSRLYPGRKGGTGHRVFNDVVNAGIYAGASYGFGYIQNRYRDRAKVAGVPVDLAAGVGLSVVAILGDLYGGRSIPHAAMSVMRDVGRAGLGAFAHTMGAGQGAQASGLKRIVVKEKDVAKIKAAVPDSVVLGAIPAAPHGDVLSARDLAELAR